MRMDGCGERHRRIARSAEQFAYIANCEDGNEAGDARTGLEPDAFRVVELGNDIDRHFRLISEKIDRAVGIAVACFVFRIHAAL